MQRAVLSAAFLLRKWWKSRKILRNSLLNLKIMKTAGFFLVALLCMVSSIKGADKIVNLRLLQTTDVHGSFFPYDFVNRTPCKGSLARVASYVARERSRYGDRLLLLDNGDILQGQPVVYYYNFIDTASIHVASAVMNYLCYDAASIGNHDIETGHDVYDRWIAECRFPVLGANVIDRKTGEPYLKPYAVFEREGVKIAVLGMITPAIPSWLPETLWSGLRFDDIETSARKWVDIIRREENPDVLIGLFHSGRDASRTTGDCVENASQLVAERVPGFDVVMMGHDHQSFCRTVKNSAGKDVLLVNAANNAQFVASVNVRVRMRKGKVVGKRLSGKLADVSSLPADTAFMSRFQPYMDAVGKFVDEKIGEMSATISTRPAYFGPSAFIDLIHSLQMAITGAEVSFAAPLSFDASIAEGDILMSDMFNLYKYENMLYVMRLSGQEIKDYLEMSYDQWTNQMKSPDDHLLLLKEEPAAGDGSRALFKNFSYNFDSAAGVRYTVDVRKPRGEKITVESMADGSPFELDRFYTVAVNSYRGNGGGGLLTEGAGIPAEELTKRIVSATDKDLRYYLMQYIKEHRVIEPMPLDQWRFVPEEWTVPAACRDRRLLFGE